jgi:hypothetical protein
MRVPDHVDVPCVLFPSSSLLAAVLCFSPSLLVSWCLTFVITLLCFPGKFQLIIILYLPTTFLEPGGI